MKVYEEGGRAVGREEGGMEGEMEGLSRRDEQREHLTHLKPSENAERLCEPADPPILPAWCKYWKINVP